ncbi:MAG: YvcK family protein, partial [Candidatus Electrothrix sp. AR3]|nr:YvcK family protein [Candidatus Electrothrix sp. AR3]
DQAEKPERLEMALLVALGQSLLGNYCLEKHMEPVAFQGRQVGRVYWLTVRAQHDLNSFLSAAELDTYLRLSRLYPSAEKKQVYARLVNGEEGFRPPGLLFGLFFAWYLDNRLAPNIDYMMSLMKSEPSDVIAKQRDMIHRREELIRFFREKVFRIKIT